MQTATKEFLASIEALAEKRKNEILNTTDSITVTGTKYYVANDGDDANDGLSPEKAWKTLDRVTEASELCEGDGVFLRRGDIFVGRIRAKAGVTYAAFGEGKKPEIHRYKSLADPALWEICDKEHHIWHYKEKILDVGVIVMNDGEYHTRKLIPSYRYGKFVCRNRHDVVFDMSVEMTNDLDHYWHYDGNLTNDHPKNGEDFPVPLMDANSYGDLYLRCDRGNPGGAFRAVECVIRDGIVTGGQDNVTVDNLTVKYGNFGIAGGGLNRKGLRITNCEIGWIGGCVQSYFGDDPNHVEGVRGEVTRYGNGIEIYGGCTDFTVENCYFYQIYDAAMSHQVTTRGRHIEMKNVLYKDNLVENTVYSIEYFLDMTEGDTSSFMDNIEMCGNILRESGYGWGQQRHNYYTPAHINGWIYVNAAHNYTIHDNIFDRAAYRIIHAVSLDEESRPEMYDNTYIQYEGNNIGRIGGNRNGEPRDIVADENVDRNIAERFGERNAKVYIIR